MKHIVALALSLVAAACASTPDRGWTGHGAEPFAAAESACRSATASAGAATRDREFEACMAERGWHRP